jgi:hypothetical protein
VESNKVGNAFVFFKRHYLHQNIKRRNAPLEVNKTVDVANLTTVGGGRRLFKMR